MPKYVKADEVIKELWAIKDSTAVRYGTVGDYLSHLKSTGTPKAKGSVGAAGSRKAAKARSGAAGRKHSI